MAAPKRTEFERERDYRTITEYYLKGWYQVDIAAELGISQGQVSQDLKTIKRRWRKDTAIDLDEATQKELERIDVLEREYWQAWERSQGERTKARQDATGLDANGKPIVSKLSSEKETLIGNPQFLNGVQWCISERCKLLGIYAPEKREHAGPGGGPIPTKTYVSISPDDWDDDNN